MGYFAPSYFGGVAPGMPPEAVPVLDGPITSDWQLLAWIKGQVVASKIFASGQVVVGRSAASSDETMPRIWVFPLGFSDRNDSLDLANRTATIATQIGVPYDRPVDNDFGSYQLLESLAAQVTDLLEVGPPGANPTLGGLLKGTYDSPVGQKENKVTPLGYMLGLTLVFAFNYDRVKPL